MQDINRLTLAAYGMHLADQIALVSVPLVAALVFEASAQTIGILVACQSMAHLLGSLPFGVLVDRAQSRTIAIVATMVSLGGFAGAAGSILVENLFWFGATVTVAGSGIVLFVLVSLSILPKIMQADQLAGANARIEIPRALSSFIVPLTVGIAITAATSQWTFLVAALCALTALTAAVRLPRLRCSIGAMRACSDNSCREAHSSSSTSSCCRSRSARCSGIWRSLPCWW